MKTTLVLLVIAGVAAAQFHGVPAPAPAPGVGGRGGGVGGGVGGAGGRAAGPLGFNHGLGVRGNPFGTQFFGMGLNNPWSIPPNPLLVQRAQAIIRNVPGALVRVDPDGELTITNQFGQERDIVDFFGNELNEAIEN